MLRLINGEYHLCRQLYSLFGFEYDEPADEKQRRLKYLTTEIIKRSNIIKLKPTTIKRINKKRKDKKKKDKVKKIK